MIALILAAGYGTRMYPLTEDTPKALLPIGSKSILELLIDKLRTPALRPRELLLVSNHRFAASFRQWFSARKLEFPGVVLDDGSTSDEDRLGSMGDLAFAIRNRRMDEDLLVLGSDNLFQEDLTGLMDLAQRNQAITLGAYELPDRKLASLYGVLSVDSQQRITSFEEKPAQPTSSLISTAVYFFPRTKLPLVLEYVSSRKIADKVGSFIAWLISRELVFAYRFRGRWIDIGDITSYQQAQESFQA